MKCLLPVIILFLVNIDAFAGNILCTTSEAKILLQTGSKNEILVQVNNESVIADGILNAEEIDIVAKFQNIGEMTLFAKIGKSDPANYLFMKGQRFSVNCR